MNPLVGQWEYVDCRIKNTSVRGTITFKKDGNFIVDAKVREDHPTPSKSVTKGSYVVVGNKIDFKNLKFNSNWYHPSPFSNYFFIKGDFLYFSNQPINKLIDDYPKSNWVYKLINNRLKKYNRNLE